MFKLNTRLVLITILLLGCFLRFYKLDQFPVQLNHDEVTQLYDAISIAHTGKDVYGNFMPVIFKSVGDYKSPFYTYTTSIFYRIFGGDELTIRLPGAIFGSLTILAVFWFVLSLLGNEQSSSSNKKIALYAAFFTAIAPFELFFSRKSFENGAGILLMLIGFSVLLMHIKNKLSTRWIYLSLFIFSIAVYTYFSHAIIIPLLLLIFILIFRKHLFPNWKKYLWPLIILLALYSPIIILTITNPDVSYRTKTVFIKQDVNLGELIKFTKTGNSFLDALFENRVLWDFSLSRYLSQFNPIYLFGNGLDLTNQGILGAGPLYLFQLPFLIFGVIYLLKQTTQTLGAKFIFFWIIIGMIPSGLTFERSSPHRVIMVFTMLNIVSAIGFYFLLSILRGFRFYLSKLLYPLIFIIMLLNISFFLHIYFINYPNEKSQSIQYPFEQIARFAWEQYDKVDTIVFDPLYGIHAPFIGTGAHYYLAYFGNYPPEKFQKEYRSGKGERETIFDKFSIRKVDWREDQNLKNVLIIASPWSLPIANISKDKIIKTFKYYDGKKDAFYAVKL